MIAIGSDHRGYDFKKIIINYFENNNIFYKDLGCYENNNKYDYPEIAKLVSKCIVKKESEKGILICGTGIGMSIAANKIKGIRAALCRDEIDAQRSRTHNNANLICLGQENVKKDNIINIINIFINTNFEEKKYINRINQISKLENYN